MNPVSKHSRVGQEAVTVAVEALSLVDLKGLGLRAAVTAASAQVKVGEEAHMREARRLAYETLSRRNLLDIVVEKTLGQMRLDDLSPRVRAFLRVFVYLTRISSRPVEPVSLAGMGRRVLGWKELIPVELALGRISRADIDDVGGGFDDEGAAVRAFNPLWFAKYTIRLFGRREALRLLSSSHRDGHVLVRLNPLKLREPEIVGRLESNGVQLNAVSGISLLYRVVKAQGDLRREMKAGLVRLQDLPSSLAAMVSGPKPGRDILLSSSTPASAATYMALLMENRGSVKVVDTSEERLSKVLGEALMAGVSIVRTQQVEDADHVSPAEVDAVILHAPSSRTGVFWRDPVLKWSTGRDRIEYFAGVQERLLDSFSQAVKSGGSLIYWNRSVAVEEDEMVVEQFLGAHPEFILAETLSRIGVPGLRGQRQSQRLFPHLHHCDGAFVARLTRL